MPPRREVRRARVLLGTFVEITACAAMKARLQRGVDDAFQAIELIHRLMSFHDQMSELSRLNEEAWRHPVRVHPAVYKVIGCAKRMAVETQGLFDCTIAPTLMRGGQLPQRVPTRVRFSGGSEDIELHANRMIRFRRPVCLDLGGIAKGYAVDQAVAALEAAKIPFGCVNAGGDLRFFGATPQPLVLRAPWNPGSLVPLGRFRETAVATSAPYFSLRRRRRQWSSHLVDPRSRRPLLASKSVSVFARSCMIADALTKAVLFARTPPLGLLRRFQASALILEADNDPLAVA